MSLAKRVVSRPVTYLIAFILIIGLGVYMVTQLPVDQFPDMEMPVMMVSTTYTNASPRTVEENVTRVLEGALANVSNVDEITSTSSKSTSTISISFNYGTDLTEATNDVRDNLERIKNRLPDDAESPTIFKFSGASMPILQLAVRGNRTKDDLYTIATETIQARLERIEGVASTNVQGGREKIIRVMIPMDRLEAYRMTITEVASALAKQNAEGSGGNVTQGSLDYVVATSGAFQSIEDIAYTVVGYAGGRAVLLRDIADVELGYEDSDNVVYINGKPGIYISVQKESGSNSIDVADSVLAQIKDIEDQLPAGINLEVVMDTTTMVRESMGQVVSSAVYGIAFAVLVLLLFLRRIRTTLIVSFAIPAAIMVTVIGMYFLEISFNMVSLTGLILALGMVVDNSIVILENIYHYREKGSKLNTAAVLGSQEMMTAITASTLTTVCVFLPLVIFQDRLGMVGQLVKDLSYTVVIALFASLGIAVTLVPALASYALPVYTTRQKPVHSKFMRAIDWFLGGSVRVLQRGYRQALHIALRFRWLTVLLVIVLFAASLSLIPRIGFQFMPMSREDTVQFNIDMPLGTVKEKTQAVMEEFEQIIEEEIIGYKNLILTLGARGGRFGGSNSNSGNSGSIMITLTGEGDDSWTAQSKLRKHERDFPDATFSFSSFNRMGGGSDLDIAIFCDDLDRALTTAGRVEQLIKQNIAEITGVEISIDTGQPQLDIVLDRQRAFDLGVSLITVNNEISAVMSGTTATVFQSAGNEYNVRVILDEKDRSDLPDLDRIFTVSNSVQRIPLAAFAMIEKTTGPANISRENEKRVVHVTGSLLPGTKADQVDAQLKSVVDSSIVQDDELTIAYVGSMSELTETGTELAVIAIMAIILVFGVMAAQFQSFKDPLIVLFTVPLLFIGVILMYVLTGEPLSIISGIGIVVLLGIVVNNGIVLVDYTNLMCARGLGVHAACIEAGVNRLRPILMTSLTTILAMTPMAFFPGQGSEQVRPIGVTVIGGLSASALITLFLIPVIYSLFNEKRRKMKQKEAEKKGTKKGPAAETETEARLPVS